MTDRVAVIRDGWARLFEANGDGVHEFATIRPGFDLEATDAVRLTMALTAFLEDARPAVHEAREAPERRLTAPIPPGLPTAGREPRGAISGPVLDYLRTARIPVPSGELARAIRKPLRSVESSCYYLRGQGILRGGGHGWEINEAEEEAPEAPLTIKAKSKAPAKRHRIGPDASREIDARVLAYVAANPGTTRTAIGKALGLKSFDSSRRVSRLHNSGRIREEKGASRHEAGKLWVIDTSSPSDAEHETKRGNDASAPEAMTATT